MQKQSSPDVHVDQLVLVIKVKRLFDNEQWI